LYAGLFIGIGIYAFILFIRTHNRAQWFSAAILVGLALFRMRWIYDLLLGILVPAEAKQMGRLPAAGCKRRNCPAGTLGVGNVPGAHALAGAGYRASAGLGIGLVCTLSSFPWDSTHPIYPIVRVIPMIE